VSSGRLRADTLLAATKKPFPPLSLDVNYRASYELPTHTLTIDNITADINQLRLKLTGRNCRAPKIYRRNHECLSDQIAVADVLSLLSPEQRAKLADYTVNGNFSLNVDLTYDTTTVKPGWLYSGSVALSDVRMSGRKFPGSWPSAAVSWISSRANFDSTSRMAASTISRSKVI